MIKIIIKEAKKTVKNTKIVKSDIEELIESYAEKLLAAGYDTSNKKFLGKGTKGEAYLLNNGKVLKVTLDPTEAKASASIAGEKTEYIARIEKVFLFGKTGYSGIIMEDLDKISNEEMNFWNELTDTGFLRDIITDSKPWSEVEPQLRKRWIEEWDANTVEQFFQNANKYNFPKMVDELYKYKIVFYDFHGDNIMKRGNQSVVIDLGYSTVDKKVPIPVIEKKK